MQTLTSFNSKLFTSCKRFLKRPFFIRAFRFRNLRKTGVKKHNKKKRKAFKFTSLLRWLFRRSKQSEAMDRVGEPKSMTERECMASFPSPLTPAYVKLAGARMRKVAAAGGDEVEEACRSFENYLVEMIVDEGKVRDLMDVEELLYCWNSLKSPVFVDLVCRFYGELCKDLFSENKHDANVDDILRI